MEKVTCCKCSAECKSDGVFAGYGIDKNENKLCYKCCAKYTEQQLMNITGKEKVFLYLQQTNGDYKVTDWTGNLRINPTIVKKGKHNFAGSRYDVWFSLNGKKFHGVNYGEFDMTLHVRAVKS